MQVRVLPEVRGHLGGTVELPCHLLPPASEVQVSQVTWMRMDAAGISSNVAVFHPLYGPSFPSPKPGKERLSFVTARQSPGAGQGAKMELRDATLALGGLTVEDEGNYTCEFATFPQGTGRGVTWLRAIGEQGGERGTVRWGGARCGKGSVSLSASAIMSTFSVVFSQLANIPETPALCQMLFCQLGTQQGCVFSTPVYQALFFFFPLFF